MGRILDSDRLAQMGRELRQELAVCNELAGDWIRRAARVMAEQILSAEVDEALGRASYQRRDDDSPSGYRNGYKDRSIKTTEGKLVVESRRCVDGKSRIDRRSGRRWANARRRWRSWRRRCMPAASRHATSRT